MLVENYKKKNFQSGFSLIELLVTLGILAVLAMIGGPSIMNNAMNRELKASAQELFADVRRARMEAVKRMANVTVAFPAVGSVGLGARYSIFLDNGTGLGGVANNGILDGKEPLIKNGVLPKDVVFFSSTFPGNTIVYNTRALPVGVGGGNIRLQSTSNPQKMYQLLFNPSGNVRVVMSIDGGTNWGEH